MPLKEKTVEVALELVRGYVSDYEPSVRADGSVYVLDAEEQDTLAQHRAQVAWLEAIAEPGSMLPEEPHRRVALGGALADVAELLDAEVEGCFEDRVRDSDALRYAADLIDARDDLDRQAHELGHDYPRPEPFDGLHEGCGHGC